MGRDIFHVIEFRDHVKLWENSKGLQPPGESLEDAIDGPSPMQEQPKHRSNEIQVIMRKTISFSIVALHE